MRRTGSGTAHCRLAAVAAWPPPTLPAVLVASSLCHLGLLSLCSCRWSVLRCCPTPSSRSARRRLESGRCRCRRCAAAAARPHQLNVQLTSVNVKLQSMSNPLLASPACSSTYCQWALQAALQTKHRQRCAHHPGAIHRTYLVLNDIINCQGLCPQHIKAVHRAMPMSALAWP